jgi:hypothetical protein
MPLDDTLGVVTTRILAGLGLLASSSCMLSQAGPILPSAPDEAASCRAATLQGHPVVAEWSAPEKATLEAMLISGTVAVEFHGCSMRVDTTCRLPGRYLWYRTSLSSDVSEIADERSLWAKLPLGAATLSGELRAAGKLAIKTLVAGQIRIEQSRPEMILMAPGCERATHIVEAVAIGAYSLSRSGSLQGKAGVEVVKVGAGGEGKREASMIRSSGNPDACDRATAQGPDKDCSSPIQVFLRPVPGRADYVGPVGTVPVQLISGAADQRWDVYYDDQPICTTPCTRWLDPGRPLVLRARDSSFMQKPDRIIVRGIGDSGLRAGGVSVEANPSSLPEKTGGIVATTFGGIGIITAIALYASGSNLESVSMQKAGIITILPSVLTTGLGIYLIIDSGPYTRVSPMSGSTVLLAPGLAGTF